MEKIKLPSLTNWLLSKGCKIWQKGNEKRIYLHKIFKTKYKDAFWRIEKNRGSFISTCGWEEQEIKDEYAKAIKTSEGKRIDELHKEMERPDKQRTSEEIWEEIEQVAKESTQKYDYSEVGA